MQIDKEMDWEETGMSIDRSYVIDNYTLVDKRGLPTKVSIHRCPPLLSVCGDKPAYWYVRKPMDKHNSQWIGYDWWYWNGEVWAIHIPKQYETPEAAYDDYMKHHVIRECV